MYNARWMRYASDGHRVQCASLRKLEGVCFYRLFRCGTNSDRRMQFLADRFLIGSEMKRLFTYTYMAISIVVFSTLEISAEPQKSQPINLSSGTIVIFDHPDVARFTQSPSIMLQLNYFVGGDRYRMGKPLNKIFAEADALEICRNYSDLLIQYWTGKMPDIAFNLVGIRLLIPVSKEGDKVTFNTWVSIFHLTNKKCGRDVRQTK